MLLPHTCRLAARSAIARLALPVLIALAAGGASARVAAAQQPERYTLSGSNVAIWNLVGRIALRPATGSRVTVAVTRSGPDAERLRVQHGELGGHDALRVTFPAEDIRYDARDYGGTSRARMQITVRVSDDGTFGSDDGHRVQISTRGGDIEARADCQVLVPEGATVTVHLAVGVVEATNVNGELTADVNAANVRGARLQGAFQARSGSGDIALTDVQAPADVRTASGDVTLSGMHGDLIVQTASGDVELRDLRTTRATVRTSSGDVRATGLALSELAITTSSGDTHLADARVPSLTLRSSSGDIDAVLAATLKSARVSASSGDVTLRVPPSAGVRIDASTGSGDVSTDMRMQVLEHGDHRFVATLGNGSARVQASTSSGDVRIVPASGGGH